jgi:hypothetical protein
MTPYTELDRLFAQELRAIPKPAPLGTVEFDREWNEQKNKALSARVMALAPIDPVDADEAVHGVCAQGDCSDDQ